MACVMSTRVMPGADDRSTPRSSATYASERPKSVRRVTAGTADGPSLAFEDREGDGAAADLLVQRFRDGAQGHGGPAPGLRPHARTDGARQPGAPQLERTLAH